MHNFYYVFSSKDVPRAHEHKIITHLGGQKSLFGGVTRRFEAKRVQYENHHIIETTEPIATKLCTAVKTEEYCSCLVRTRVQQIQDGGQPPSCKNR